MKPCADCGVRDALPTSDLCADCTAYAARWKRQQERMEADGEFALLDRPAQTKTADPRIDTPRELNAEVDDLLEYVRERDSIKEDWPWDSTCTSRSRSASPA